MDEVRIVRKRTHVWPVVIAVVVLALVIAFVLFMNHTGSSTPWNGVMAWPVDAIPGVAG
jgi:hypothetical protein